MAVTYDLTATAQPPIITHTRQEQLTFVLPTSFTAASVTEVIAAIRGSVDGRIYEWIEHSVTPSNFTIADNQVTVVFTPDNTRYIKPSTLIIGVTVKTASDEETPLNTRLKLLGAASNEGGGALEQTDYDEIMARIDNIVALNGLTE